MRAAWCSTPPISTSWSVRAWTGCARSASRFHALVDEHGAMFVVRSANLDYLRPARLGDALDVSLALVQIGRRATPARSARHPRGRGTGHRDHPARLHRRARFPTGAPARAAARRMQPLACPGDPDRMNGSTDLSILHLVANASLLVQIVMADPARHLLRVVVVHLPQDVLDPLDQAQDRGFRAAVSAARRPHRISTACSSPPPTRARTRAASRRSAWPGSASSGACAGRPGRPPRSSWTARGAPCAPPTSARWTTSSRT